MSAPIVAIYSVISLAFTVLGLSSFIEHPRHFPCEDHKTLTVGEDAQLSDKNSAFNLVLEYWPLMCT